MKCRRWAGVIVLCALVGGSIAGVVWFRYMPVQYRVNGVILLFDVETKSSGSRADGNIESMVRCCFMPEAAGERGCLIQSDIMDGTAVIDWQLIFHDAAAAEKFLSRLPELIKKIRGAFKKSRLSFSADSCPAVFRDFKTVSLHLALAVTGGGFIGLIFCLAVIFIAVCSDRSIGDLREFVKNYSLPILGVLPEVAGCSNMGSEKLSEDVRFQSAVDSLQLNVQMSKIIADRALVVAVSGLKKRNEASVVALYLSESLKKNNFRVLLVNKENTDMTLTQQLSRRMEAFLADAAEKYDFIIIDVPDAQNTSAPLILGRLADVVLLVCSCMNCPHYLLQVVLWRLRRAKVNVSGCVINRFQVDRRYEEYDFYQFFFRHYNL